MSASEAYDVLLRTLLVLLPEFVILISATVMMTAGAFVQAPRRIWAAISAGTLVVALVALLVVWERPTAFYTAVVLNDALACYARLVLLLSGLILLGLAHDQVADDRAAEFFGVVLMILAGAMIVAAANELVLLFAGLELISIPAYVLLYLTRRDAATQEAATKYFFLSIFSSALLLYGLAFLYGITGVSNLKALAYLTHANLPGIPNPYLGLVAVVFILAGLGFRVAAVPFHFYAPDVYQGSPAVLAALLAWIPKGVGFLAILKTLTAVFAQPTVGGLQTGPLTDKAVLIAWVIAVVTLTLGNTVALVQENLKRLLAYSSIAHAGYLMIGVTAAFRNSTEFDVMYLGSEGILFYLVAYALMTLGAFGVIVALSTPERPVETVEDLTGLSETRPLWALALALCLFSLAGIPPLAGFWGKLAIFGSALSVARDDEVTLFRLLALIGVLNAAIAAYYYLRIVMVMYFRPARQVIAVRPAWPSAVAVGACAVLSLAIGLVSEPVFRAARTAAIAAITTTPIEDFGPAPPAPQTVLTAPEPTSANSASTTR